MTLTEFLLARIAERERFARKRLVEWERPGMERMLRKSPDSPLLMLAECEAKRRLLNLWATQDECGERADQGEARAFLALPYADHDDYREEWRP